MLRIEPLEGRWLFTGGVPALAELTGHEYLSASSHVEILEVAPADPDDDRDETVISPADLPASVVATLNRLFPGAAVSDAVRGVDDGGMPEYGASVRAGDETIVATFKPDGTLIETEQPLTSADLPADVLAWVGRQFPEAAVAEASAIRQAGQKSFELVITDPSGKQYEANVRSVSPRSARISEFNPTDPSPATRSEHRDAAESADILSASGPYRLAQAIARDAKSEQEHPESEQAIAPREPAADAPAVNSDESLIGDLTRSPAQSVAYADASISRGSRDAGFDEQSVWALPIIHAIAGVFQIDTTITLRNIEGVLRDVDQAATQVFDAALTPRNGLTAAGAVMVLLGGHLLIRQRRTAETRTAIAAVKATDLSWGWRLRAPSVPMRGVMRAMD